MFKFFTAILIFGLITSISFAQVNTSKIEGSIIDSITNKPIIYATVTINITAVKVKSVASDDSGKFVLDKISFGRYKITINRLGYKTKDVFIDVVDTVTKSLLITLSSSTNTLNEVSISGQSPIIKRDLDRFTYDVQADPDNSFSNLFEILKKVPLVSADGDDNIQIMGSANFKVLINGKSSNRVAKNIKDIFKSIPANSIKKIEVITTPPSNYDSEGFSGILNVIMARKEETGFTNSFTSRYNIPFGPTFSDAFSLKSGKMGVQANLVSSIRNTPKTDFTNLRLQDNPKTTFEQVGQTLNKVNTNRADIELSYEIDSLKLLTGSVGIGRNIFRTNNWQVAKMFDGNLIPIQSYNLDNNGKNIWQGLDFGLDYQLTSKSDLARVFTLSYKYSPYKNEEYNNSLFYNTVAFNVPNYFSNNTSGTNEHTLQLDYISPMGKFIVEAGGKAILRSNFSDFAQNTFDNIKETYVVDETNSNSFDYQQNVFSIYNSYSYRDKKIRFKFGLRFERTDMDANFNSTSTELQKKYNNLVPSISFQYLPNKKSSVSIGYTQRIERPNIELLNPFISNLDPKLVSVGNPNLNVVLSNNIEINYSLSFKGMLNIGSFYSFIKNKIEYISMYDPDNNITTFSYANVGNNKKIGMSLYLSYPFTKMFNFNFNANMSYVNIEGYVNGNLTKNDGLFSFASLNASYKLNKSWSTSYSASFNGPWITLQGKSNSAFYYSANISKTILNNNLRFSGGISNPFKSFRYYKTQFTMLGSTQFNTYQNYYRTFNISMTYKFGRIKGAIKTKERGINNDDIAPPKNM